MTPPPTSRHSTPRVPERGPSISSPSSTLHFCRSGWRFTGRSKRTRGRFGCGSSRWTMRSNNPCGGLLCLAGLGVSVGLLLQLLILGLQAGSVGNPLGGVQWQL